MVEWNQQALEMAWKAIRENNPDGNIAITERALKAAISAYTEHAQPDDDFVPPLPTNTELEEHMERYSKHPRAEGERVFSLTGGEVRTLVRAWQMGRPPREKRWEDLTPEEQRASDLQRFGVLPGAYDGAPKLDPDRNEGRRCVCGADLSEPGSRLHHYCQYTRDEPNASPPKVRLATDLPAPREVSPAEMSAATEEAREVRARLDKKMAGMQGAPVPASHEALVARLDELQQRTARNEHRVASVEGWLVTFLASWARGSFNKDAAGNLLGSVKRALGGKGRADV